MRIMAVDYGDARTGIAISDATGMLAGFTTVIHSRKEDAVAAEIARLAAEHGVEELALGYPKHMNDTIGDRARLCEAFADRLRRETGLSVTLWDERSTTVDAHRILSENNRRGKRRRNTVDAVAASLILEGFLAYRRSHPRT